MNDYVAGATSIVETVFIQDNTSTVGAGKTGLVYNTASLTCYYKRSNGTAAVAVTLANITTLGTYVSGGFKEIDAANMPGMYEFHPPDAAFASGAKHVTFYFKGASGMVVRIIKVRILAVNPDDTVRMGLTALPNVAQGNAGQLATADANARVDVIKIAGTTQTAKDLGALNVTQINTLASHDPGTTLGTSTYSSTGDAYAYLNTNLGALGANLTGLPPATVRSALGLSSANLDAQLNAIAGYIDTEVATILGWVDTEITSILGVLNKVDTMLVLDGAVYQLTANALELAPTGGAAPTAADIRAEIDANSTKLADILADTAEIGAAGAGLTNVPWNVAWDAEVQSECADALTAYDPPTNAEMEARTLPTAEYATAANQTTLLNRIGAFTGTGVNTILGFLKALMSKSASTPSDVGGTFDATTDSTEALRDRGDAAWTGGGGGGGTPGTGAISWTPLITLADATPVSNAQVWITTDAAGTNSVAGPLLTEADGETEQAFLLDAGSYYMWVQKPGVNFDNPTSITVS